jgi:transposase
MVKGKDPRHSFYESPSDYGGVPQKWLLVHSTENQTRKEKTFENTLKRLDSSTTKSLKKLLALEFACEKDAQAAADHWAENHPWYLFQKLILVPLSGKVTGKRGRPKNDQERCTVFKIQAEIERKVEAINAEKGKLGRFILASNDYVLASDLILEYYKNQGAIEKLFRFLKDRSYGYLKCI